MCSDGQSDILYRITIQKTMLAADTSDESDIEIADEPEFPVMGCEESDNVGN